MTHPRHVCFVSLHYDQRVDGADPRGYLERVPIHRELPRLVAARGHEVSLVHLFPRDARFVEDSVSFNFVAPDPVSWLVGAGVRRWTSRDPAVYQPALRAIRLIRALRPDVVHFHGLTLTWNLGLLLLALGDRAPIVAHYHGGYPARHPLARRVQRFNLARVARALFTTRSHAEPFQDAGLLRADQIAELVETSSVFHPGDRRLARSQTGMRGDPVFLWVGRLDPIKDPLSALRGFERIAAARPEARLYLHYLDDTLLPAAQAFVASRPGLAERVEFRGPLSFTAMENLYNSADFLLQASHREFSGCAVLEALACGVIPAVTDIPSFRAMTDDGRHGVLFPIGDPAALAQGVLAIPRAELPARSAAARRWFEQALSFDALAARLDAIYAEFLTPDRSATKTSAAATT